MDLPVLPLFHFCTEIDWLAQKRAVDERAVSQPCRRADVDNDRQRDTQRDEQGEVIMRPLTHNYTEFVKYYQFILKIFNYCVFTYQSEYNLKLDFMTELSH